MNSHTKNSHKLTGRLIGDDTFSVETSRTKQTLPYVLRWTLRSLSLSGAFGGAEITEIRPGIIAVHIEDCEVVDAWLLESLLSCLAERWALVHGLKVADVDLDVRGA